jgi:hypothetical protein
LFIIILLFTVAVFKSSPYWTYYEDGGKVIWGFQNICLAGSWPI